MRGFYISSFDGTWRHVRTDFLRLSIVQKCSHGREMQEHCAVNNTRVMVTRELAVHIYSWRHQQLVCGIPGKLQTRWFGGWEEYQQTQASCRGLCTRLVAVS